MRRTCSGARMIPSLPMAGVLGVFASEGLSWLVADWPPVCGVGAGCARVATAREKSKQLNMSANEERDMEASCPFTLAPLVGLRRSGTRLRVSVLIITLYGSEDLSKKAFLLLIRVVVGTSCCRCGTNCIVRRDGTLWLVCHRDCHRGRWRRLVPQPEKLLEEVTLVRGNV